MVKSRHSTVNPFTPRSRDITVTPVNARIQMKQSPQPHMIMFLVICKMHSDTKTYLKSSDILSLLLEARLVSDKLAPVSSLQAWNDCLGSTFALSRPVSDWERCKSLRCSSATQIKTIKCIIMGRFLN